MGGIFSMLISVEALIEVIFPSFEIQLIKKMDLNFKPIKLLFATTDFIFII